MWETLIFGTGDWFAFGEAFFCGLFTPTNPLPGHRLVPESHYQSVEPTPKQRGRTGEGGAFALQTWIISIYRYICECGFVELVSLFWDASESPPILWVPYFETDGYISYGSGSRQ